jgi:hypothetical protein
MPNRKIGNIPYANPVFVQYAICQRHIIKNMQKGPVAERGKALFVVGSTLEFGTDFETGGISLLRFVAKMSAFRHWKNEEEKRRNSKGIRRSYYGGLSEDLKLLFHDLCPVSKLICGLRTHVRASESGAR